MKNGLIKENEKLIYYKDGIAYHAGVIKEGKDIYYIGSGGYAVKGTHIVHRKMANGILKRGTYTFGEDYKLDPNSYVPPNPNSYVPPKKVKERRKKKAAKKKNFGKQLVLVAVIATIIVTVFGIAIGIQQIIKKPTVDSVKQPEQIIVLPTFEKDVLLCSEPFKQAYDGKISIQQAIATGEPYKPFEFKYQLKKEDGTLLISEYPDLRNAKEIVLSSKENSIRIENLKTGTMYYYIVTIGGEIYPGSFHTAESTRFISLPGIYNTRDIGGYTTLDGKKVRQGMLIRGTELDGLGTVNDGDAYFLKDIDSTKPFEFVSEIDLRSEIQFSSNYKSRLGESVKHLSYDNSFMYKSIFTEEGKQAVKKVFSDLSNPNNYPIYLHCTYGADRTGTTVFLLLGLLGVNEEQMLNEYRWTGIFSKDFENNTKINGIFGGLEEYEGNTVNEKIENFIISTGVTKQQIESIRNIFLEEK